MPNRFESFNAILRSMDDEIRAAKAYAARHQDVVSRALANLPKNLSSDLMEARDAGQRKYRIGYIVATCSPATVAHIELAKQAIETLRLDHVFFLIWPFYTIPEFHTKNLAEWSKAEQHLSHRQREYILHLSIQDAQIPASIYANTTMLYAQSAANFDAAEYQSRFWTGTWFVIRCMQQQILRDLRISASDAEFYFVCGEDQFNPNIHAFVSRQLEQDNVREKVWTDYCIAQQLAIHNVFAVPRNTEDTMEYFEAPLDCWRNSVRIGTHLTCHQTSATRIRRGAANPIEFYCTPSAAAYIREKGFWGYGATSGEPLAPRTTEMFQPLRRFLPSGERGEPKSNGSDRLLAVKRGDEEFYIQFAERAKPHFTKYHKLSQ